jgi:next-to-BRCA1 protein 1
MQKCLSCPDFDTCSSCFEITTEQHPLHGFVCVRAQGDMKVYQHLLSEYMRSMLLQLKNARASQARHGAWCNACKNVIVGVRYKVLLPHSWRCGEG